jgi:sugar lactone lactonase YvrE
VASNKINGKKSGRYSAMTIAAGAVAALLLSGCHGGDNGASNGNGSTTSSTPSGNGSGGGPVTPGGNGTGSGPVTVGGTVAGVTASGLTLQDNGIDSLPVAIGATGFTFPTPLVQGSSYSVSISEFPAGQFCGLSNEAGTAGANVTSVAINCTSWGPTTAITSVLAGSSSSGGLDGTGSAATFTDVAGLVADSSGNVYLTDVIEDTIRKITPQGVVTTIAGTSGTSGDLDGTGTGASFRSPNGIAMDASGNLFVVDSGNNEIRKVTPAGVVTTFAGNPTAGSHDATGTAASFDAPLGIAIDAQGDFYVTDEGNGSIRKITSVGAVTTIAGGSGSGFNDATGTAAKFQLLGTLTVAPSGNLFVADQDNDRIREVTPTGAVTTFAGNGTASSSDGTGTAATFIEPYGITSDSAGNLYVTESGRAVVRMITPGGVVTTLAGNGTSGQTDGVGTAADFSDPLGIATVLNDLVVASTTIVRKISRTH